MARLTDETVAMFFGGDFDPDNGVTKEGDWPSCHLCGKAHADLYWHGVRHQTAYTSRPGNDCFCVCFDCAKGILGGLVVDLMLEQQGTPEEITADLVRRYRNTRFGRVRHEFPGLTDTGYRLVQDDFGRAFIVSVHDADCEVRDEMDAEYDLGESFNTIGEWLLEITDDGLHGEFDGDMDYINHLLKRD
jgi:hypothetical protein